MISVLIPIFNCDITNLVSEIHKQMLFEKIDFEIICIDDASTINIPQNAKIQSFKNVYSWNLEKNIGRSKIRNLLAEKSKFEWLLFLDCDVIPVKSNFIKNYINAIKTSKKMFFNGGIKYYNSKPNKKYLLRWLYGKKRENVSLKNRLSNPYKYFFSANFLVNKTIFKKHKFDKDIVNYGYEDYLFAKEMKDVGIVLNHIDNPIYHIVNNDETIHFLEKTKEAMNNLLQLWRKDKINVDDINILNTLLKLKKYHLNWLISVIYILCSKIFEKNLKSNKPSLLIFDLYRISYLCFIEKRS